MTWLGSALPLSSIAGEDRGRGWIGREEEEEEREKKGDEGGSHGGAGRRTGAEGGAAIPVSLIPGARAWRGPRDGGKGSCQVRWARRRHARGVWEAPTAAPPWRVLRMGWDDHDIATTPPPPPAPYMCQCRTPHRPSFQAQRNGYIITQVLPLSQGLFGSPC